MPLGGKVMSKSVRGREARPQGPVSPTALLLDLAGGGAGLCQETGHFTNYHPAAFRYLERTEVQPGPILSVGNVDLASAGSFGLGVAKHRSRSE